MSKDKDAQLYSLENQMKAFQAKIILHPEMDLVGIYADEDKSGTSKKGRGEFQRMLDDCKEGKIDYVITKSVSRFARNTVDSLTTVRELADLGIPVCFEKENI